jgi:integrase
MRGVRVATISATWVPFGDKFRVLIRPANHPRLSRVVPTKQDAVDLSQHFNRLGLAGVDLAQALAEAKGENQRLYPPLPEVLPTFLDEQVELKNLRASTARAYKNRLLTWAYPKLRQTPWNLVQREDLGALLLAIRKAGKSSGSVEQVRCPISRFYQWQVEVEKYKGPNPAADLKFFVGKQPSKKKRKRDIDWFPREDARELLKAAKILKPRWHPLLVVGFTGGLRYGELAALERTDLDAARARVHVQRTWSEKGRCIERCKDDEDRWVKLPASTFVVLAGHLEAMTLEGQLHKWDDEQRRLVFPNGRGKILRHSQFLEHVWQDLVEKTKLPYRKPHAMRHSYASWLLEEGADLRYVKDQMGHASIEETESSYGHLARERHEQRVDLGGYLGL